MSARQGSGQVVSRISRSFGRARLFLPLLGVAACLIGIAYIQSASYDARTAQFATLGRTQAQWLLVSLAAFAATVVIPYQRIESVAYALYALGLVLLLGLHFFAPVVNGARSWYQWGSVKFEPSETMKLALVAAVARLLKHRRDVRTWRGFVAPFLLAAPPLALILKQPDLGSTMILSFALLSMVFAAGARLRHFALAFGPVIVGFPLVYRFALKAHQKQRIDTFLGAFDGLQPVLERLGFHPERDVRHAGYQVAESVKAIGSGGVWGAGWREGAQTQAHAVPEAHTDFIFSVIGEEGGFIMAVLVVTLLFAIVVGCLEIGWRTREPFGRLLAVGYGSVFAAQVVVNVGMTVGLAPVTGITLPFVSYGGSSLLTCFLALGLVNNVGMRQVHELGSQG